MLIIGIESSAHTFGVGIVSDSKILANEKEMYPIKDKGMIPSKVAMFHIKNFSKVIKRALEKANIKIRDIDGISYTMGPGMGPSLQVGELVAKTLAKELKVPIVPVNHAMGHIEIAKHFGNLNDPIALYVSGGNSQIIKKFENRYRVIGETLDIGIGNLFDNFAREAKLVPAWGSTVAKLAEKGKFIEMPYTVKGMDFAFTGLLTYSKKLIGKVPLEDICFSLQETAFSMVCEATERALLLTNTKELCVCGGVAQSKRLKEMLSKIAKENNIKFGYAPDEYNADNGAMIAYVGEKLLKCGISKNVEECSIKQRYRIEDAIIC